MALIRAPWTNTQVELLNYFQAEGVYRPLTCPRRARVDHGDNIVLVAENDGLRCQVCDYTQNWALDFMLG